MILKEAWEQTNKLWLKGDKLHFEANKLLAEADKLYAEANKIWFEGNNLYTKAVEGFFEPGASINWNTGKVEGKPLPIPACELGIK